MHAQLAGLTAALARRARAPPQAISGHEDGSLRLWEVASKASKKYPSTVMKGHTGPVTCCVFTPKVGEFVLSGSVDCTAIVWSTEAERTTTAPLRTLRGHTAPLVAAAWLPGGLLALTAALDGACRIWDQEGLCRHALFTDAPVTALAVSDSVSARPKARVELLTAGGRAAARLDRSPTRVPRRGLMAPAPEMSRATLDGAAASPRRSSLPALPAEPLPAEPSGVLRPMVLATLQPRVQVSATTRVILGLASGAVQFLQCNVGGENRLLSAQ